MLKRYYKIELTQSAPLHLSNGDSQDSDSDLMKDGRNMPFIPGTGLIGALRDLLAKEKKDMLFGWIKGEKQQASRVIGSDAVLPSDAKEEDIRLTYRDGVSLDLIRGTAVKGAKYDLETVETKLPYTSVLEWTGREIDESLPILENLISRVVAAGLSLGGKVTRGYGAMQVSAWERTFRFPEDLQAWLIFDPRSKTDKGWTPVQGKADEAEFREYEMSFSVAGPIAVRIYSTAPGKADFEMMKNAQGKPVIPGTSWAGAFRHRMHEIARELGLPKEDAEALDAFFGKLKDGMRRSDISFSETEIQGGEELQITRNALDRFTSSTAMSALFSAGYWYGGQGMLKIRIRKEALKPLFEQLLAATIKDLDLGLMTIGGGASTGLGQLRITGLKVDGQSCELREEVRNHA